jgi:hypothetical protein
MRMPHAQITGVTVAGAENTASTNLIIDRNGATITATNVTNMSGLDTISLLDSTSPATGGDGGSLTGLTSGQTIQFLDDFNSSTFTFNRVTGSSDSATIALDNATASTDTDVAVIDIQDVETLTINSNGNVSTSTTAQNLIDDLTGDATTITVGGDTSIDIDLNIDAPSSGSRTVTVDASSNTAFVTNAAAANTSVAYNITGTDGADTLVLNATTGTLDGGAGNDILTSGAGSDTVTGGAGNDHIDVSTGTDTLSGGAGNDTYDLASQGTLAVAQVSQTAALQAAITGAVGDTISLNIDGRVYSQFYATSEAATAQAFVTAHAATILSTHGVTVITTDTSTKLQATGKSDGTAFTMTSIDTDAGVDTAVAVTIGTAGVTGVTQDANISDFASGDILDFADIANETTLTYYEGVVASATANDTVMVLTDAAGFADAEAVEDAIIANAANSVVGNDAVIAFFNSTLGHAQVIVDDNADNAADAANLGGTTGVAIVVDLTGITNTTQLAEAFSSSSFVL